MPDLGIATNRRVLNDLLEEVRQRGVGGAGGEGVMIRDPDAYYEFKTEGKPNGKHSDSIMKYKYKDFVGEARVVPGENASLLVETEAGARFKLQCDQHYAAGTILTFQYKGYKGGIPKGESFLYERTDGYVWQASGE